MTENEKTTAPMNLDELIDRRVTVWCANFIYAGTFVRYDNDIFVLRDPHVVYETGALTDKQFKDAQPLSADTWFVARTAVESLGLQRDG